MVLVREPGALERSFGHEESYIRRTGAVNLVERTLEYSRPINSLKLWLALRTHGAAAFRGWIEHTLGLAAELTRLVRADPEFELLHEPQLSTVCFRHVPAGVGDLDAHNSALADAAVQDGRVFLADAVVDGNALPARVLRELPHPHRGRGLRPGHPARARPRPGLSHALDRGRHERDRHAPRRLVARPRRRHGPAGGPARALQRRRPATT